MGSLNSESTQEFVKLLTGHQASLRAFIVSLSPGSPEVDDILQETNIILWEKISDFELGTNFQAWAFSIARNNVKASLRKTKRNQSPQFSQAIIDAIADTWYQRESSDSDVSRKLSALEFCINTLSENARALLKARYFDTNSLESQAQTFDRSAQSLRVSLFRIREKLRQCVKARIALKEGGAL